MKQELGRTPGLGVILAVVGNLNHFFLNNWFCGVVDCHFFLTQAVIALLLLSSATLLVHQWPSEMDC